MRRAPSVRLMFHAAVGLTAAVMLAVCAASASYAYQRWRAAEHVLAVVTVSRDLFAGMQNLRAERGSVVAGLDGTSLDPANLGRIADVRAQSNAALKGALAGLSQLDDGDDRRDAAVLTRDLQRLGEARRRADEALGRKAGGADQVQAWLHADDAVVNSVADLSERLSFEVGQDDPFVFWLSMLARNAWTARAAAGSAWMTLHEIMRQGRPPTLEQREALTKLEGRIDALWGLVRERAARNDTPREIKAAAARADRLYFGQTTARLDALLADLEAGRPTNLSGPAWLDAARPGLASLMEAPKVAFELAGQHARMQALAAERRFYLVMLSMVGVLAFAWAGAWLVGRRFVTPMAEITEATRKVAAGRLDSEIPHQNRSDEIGALARALDIFRENALAKARVEQELSRSEGAVKAAEAASQIKSQFLANMSHEIRTPLNGVLGMVQAMELDDATPAQRERLRTIRDSGETLLQILNDVLDFSKIEAGKLELAPEPFDLKDLVRRTCAVFTDMAEAKGLELRWTVSSKADGAWEGDPARIRQMLMNLLSNALKFTERGWISVTADARPEGLRLTVRDTGVGIEPEHLPRLFAKFSQVDESSTRRFGGTGLGLAICRELAELMGGDIEVESARGQGSAFRLRLPLKRVAATDPAPQAKAARKTTAERPATAQLRVLAAEDNPTNQKVLAALLGAVGVDLTVVSNGAEAVEAWRHGDFDLILMDIQMPGVNGVTATRLIREAEAAEGRAYTPIIAVSANAMSHQIAEYRDVGMDAHVAKPIQTSALHEAMLEALASAPSTAGAAHRRGA